MSSEPADAMRLALMEIVGQLEPIHEFVMGEVAYFERQGFSAEQSRAMVAAEYTSIFGLRILNAATEPGIGDGQPS